MCFKYLYLLIHFVSANIYILSIFFFYCNTKFSIHNQLNDLQTHRSSNRRQLNLEGNGKKSTKFSLQYFFHIFFSRS